MEKFHFRGFVPDETLRTKADRALDRVLERAPSDSRVTALVEKAEDGRYRCLVEIGSASCPIRVDVSHRIPAMAVDRAEFNVMARLARWRGTRFVPVGSPPIRPPRSLAAERA